LDLLTDEIGVDTAQFIMEQSEQKIEDVIKNPNHLFYPALVMSIFNIMFQTKCKSDFIGTYTVMPTELQCGDSKNKLFRKTFSEMIARPVIVMILHKWYVVHRNTRVECVDVIDAILKWMQMICVLYEGKLETHVSMTIHHFSDQFLSETGGVVAESFIEQSTIDIQQRYKQKRKKKFF
jgi:hypothetical protein